MVNLKGMFKQFGDVAHFWRTSKVELVSSAQLSACICVKFVVPHLANPPSRVETYQGFTNGCCTADEHKSWSCKYPRRVICCRQESFYCCSTTFNSGQK